MTSNDPEQLLPQSPRPCCAWRPALAVAAIVAVCFSGLAPLLSRIEFSNGGENAVVASVQEIRRGGPWLMPTLNEEQRTKKPPLATWISALAAQPATVAKFSDPNPAIRDQAFRDFAWQVRWPALVAMCGVIVATAVLGTLIGGARLGVIAAAVCGSNLFWLQSARLASTDVQLALWVSVANCLLAWGLFSRKWWPALIGAGAALALAMMSKGPVALLQSVVPMLAFAGWRRWRRPVDNAENSVVSRRRFFAPLIVGLLVFFVLGGAWYFIVWWKHPSVWAEWMVELTRKGATGLEPSRWYNYILLLGILFPWTLFLIIGIAGSMVNAFRKQPGESDKAGDRIVLALSLLIVPILIMSLFPDRKLRYLIPMISPTSILAGWAVLELLAPAVRWRHAGKLVAGLHWLPLAIAALGLPIATQFGYLERLEGGPWYSLRVSIIAAEVFAVLIVIAMLAQRRWRVGAVVCGTLIVMVLWNAFFDLGYRTFREGRSEMRPLAELILKSHPNAAVYSYRADRTTRFAPTDLAIYLNRAVGTLHDLSELKDKTGERVYIVRQRGRAPLADPSPMMPPVGGPWTFFAATPVDEATWYAFLAN